VVAGDHAIGRLVFLREGVVGAFDLGLLDQEVPFQLQSLDEAWPVHQLDFGADVLDTALVQLRHLGAGVDLGDAADRRALARFDIAVDVDRAAWRELVIEHRDRGAKFARHVAHAAFILADALDRVDVDRLAACRSSTLLLASILAIYGIRKFR